MKAEPFDLASCVRPGDVVVCGQAAGEPLTLTRQLVRDRARLPDCTVFLGALYSDTFDPDQVDGLTLQGYGGIGTASRLSAAGRLDVLPLGYAALSRAFADRRIRADCVLLQLAPGRDGRPACVAMSNDYAALAARHARVVIAEVNPWAPWTHGSELPEGVRIAAYVEAERPPVQLAPPEIGPRELEIGRRVADIIPDGATIQTGVGAIAAAVLASMGGHRDIGVHSGVIFEGMVDLIERGVITNARKAADAGVTVGGNLLGARRLFDHVDENPAIRLAPPPETHGVESLRRIDNFVAINSALEVDLTGQVNSEIVNGGYVGGIGGQVDFVRGALESRGGRSIIALASTGRGGVSRIVPRLATVTSPCSDADTVVTEWGVAELRGCTLSERPRRMIAVAAPEHREALARAYREFGQKG